MQRPRAILLLLGGVWLTTGACSVHTGARPPTAPSPTATFHPVTTPTGSAAAPATSGTAPTTPVPTPVATTMAGTAPGNTPVQPGYWPTQGWTAAQPEDQGMDPQLPAQVDDYVRHHLPGVHSILVVRHGYLVLERYYGGYTRNVAHAVQSVTKSVTSALIGIALDTGALASLDQPVVAFFPEYVTPALDPRKREITIRHLLTMTSGLQWEEADPTTRTGAVQRWRESSNQVKYVLELPLAQPPGTAFNYNSAGSHLLSAILTKATGMRTLEFANRQLFDPLGIEVLWAMDQQGINYGGFGLLMQPVDMAKFGYLYLQRGFWDGKQLVPEAWVKESTRAQLPDGLLTGEATYGYHWWVLEQSRPPAFCATGLGGQYLCVIPDLGMVVVIAANATRKRIDPIEVIGRVIIPAARRE